MKGLTLLLASALLAVTACAGGSVTPPVSPTVEPTPTDAAVSTLLLVQVLAPDGYAVDNALLGVVAVPPMRSSAQSRLAFVPASLLVPTVEDGPSSEITLGATAEQTDTLTPWLSSAAAFDLDVTGSWTLDRLAFAGLIDAVDGVVVDVPRAVDLGGLAGEEPDEGIVISPGRQRLSGVVGADYATVHVPGESEREALERFRDVFVSVLARLPEEPERLRQILTSLGSLARTTTDVDTIMSTLAGAHQALLAENMQEAYVEVDIIRSGARPASILSEEGSRTVASMFADFEPAPVPTEGTS